MDEPSETKAILMMRGIASPLEKHHKVQILDEAIEAAVRLSHRYIPARQLPDKSVSLLDTAAARVAISQHAVPAEVDDCRRRIQALETETEIIGREDAIGIDTALRGASVAESLEAERGAACGARGTLGGGEGARRSIARSAVQTARRCGAGGRCGRCRGYT